MTEIMYYPLIDCDTEGTEKVAMIPTPNGNAVRSRSKLWLEEMIPYRFRLYTNQDTQTAENFRIRCPRCGKVLDRIGRDVNKTKLGLYVCSSCTKIKEEKIMSVYPLHPYSKGGTTLYPSSCFYTEEYAQRICAWHLTDQIITNEKGKHTYVYRLRSHDPRTFANFMQYDIMCPRCNQRLRPIQNALDYHELALYAFKLRQKEIKENLFQQIATNICAYGSGYRIRAKDTNDLAVFVPEGGEIPLENTIHDFTAKSVDSHKLAVFVKTDEDFIRDASFDFESYLTARLAKNFCRAEENGFINGTDNGMPTGILTESNGAGIVVTTDALTHGNVVKLFFSVKPEYRRNGVWFMNDETALSLRTLKDADGNYIWNHNNDTILGKPVRISQFMPGTETGSKPVAFGDFSYYCVIDRYSLAVRSIKEKFVQMGQIGHLATEFLDGKLIRPEAIKVMHMTDNAA